MTKLEQLNEELSLHDSNRITLIAKIDAEYKLEQAIKAEPHLHLLGKCFVSKHSDNSYKILKISSIEPDGRIMVQCVICQSAEIYQYKKIHDETNVTEITLQQFETNLIQACRNMK